MPRYGTINSDYLASWFQREDPGGPMWALNLMQYREWAEYADGRETDLTGAQADDVYMPHEHLAAVGSRIILMARSCTISGETTGAGIVLPSRSTEIAWR